MMYQSDASILSGAFSVSSWLFFHCMSLPWLSLIRTPEVSASTFLCDIILFACWIPANRGNTCIDPEFAGADSPEV